MEIWNGLVTTRHRWSAHSDQSGTNAATGDLIISEQKVLSCEKLFTNILLSRDPADIDFIQTYTLPSIDVQPLTILGNSCFALRRANKIEFFVVVRFYLINCPSGYIPSLDLIKSFLSS